MVPVHVDHARGLVSVHDWLVGLHSVLRAQSLRILGCWHASLFNRLPLVVVIILQVNGAAFSALRPVVPPIRKFRVLVGGPSVALHHKPLRLNPPLLDDARSRAVPLVPQVTRRQVPRLLPAVVIHVLNQRSDFLGRRR